MFRNDFQRGQVAMVITDRLGKGLFFLADATGTPRPNGTLRQHLARVFTPSEAARVRLAWDIWNGSGKARVDVLLYSLDGRPRDHVLLPHVRRAERDDRRRRVRRVSRRDASMTRPTGFEFHAEAIRLALQAFDRAMPGAPAPVRETFRKEASERLAQLAQIYALDAAPDTTASRSLGNPYRG